MARVAADFEFEFAQVSMDVAAAAASLREPRKLSRVICLLGICGVLAVLNLMTSSGQTWFLLGRDYEYAD